MQKEEVRIVTLELTLEEAVQVRNILNQLMANNGLGTFIKLNNALQPFESPPKVDDNQDVA